MCVICHVVPSWRRVFSLINLSTYCRATFTLCSLQHTAVSWTWWNGGKTQHNVMDILQIVSSWNYWKARQANQSSTFSVCRRNSQETIILMQLSSVYIWLFSLWTYWLWSGAFTSVFWNMRIGRIREQQEEGWQNSEWWSKILTTTTHWWQRKTNRGLGIR